MISPSISRIILFWLIKFPLFNLFYSTIFHPIVISDYRHDWFIDAIRTNAPALIASIVFLTYPLLSSFKVKNLLKHFMIIAAIFLVEIILYDKFDRYDGQTITFYLLPINVLFYFVLFGKYTKTYI